MALNQLMPLPFFLNLVFIVTAPKAGAVPIGASQELFVSFERVVTTVGTLVCPCRLLLSFLRSRNQENGNNHKNKPSESAI